MAQFNTKSNVEITEIISASLTLYKNNFIVLAAISAVMFLGDLILLWLKNRSVASGYLALFQICEVAVSVFATVALFNAVSVFFQGESIDLKLAFSKARGRFWMYVFVTAFCSLAIGIGFVLLIIPGIYISVVLFLASASAALNDRPFFDHLRISKMLVRGYFWNVLSLCLLVLFLACVPILFYMLKMLKWGSEITAVLIHGIGFLIAPIIAAMIVIPYHKLYAVKQSELSVFEGAKETKGSQLGLGILSCFGLGITALGAFVAFFISLATLYSFIPGLPKICPLPQKTKSAIRYLTEDDRLTKTLLEPKVIEKEPYVLYIPAGTDIQKKHPMIIILSPNDDPTPIVEAWKPAADQHKWILYGSKKYSNKGEGMYAQSVRIVSLLDEIYSHLPVDKTMVMASGFSGGGMGAHEFAHIYPDLIKAVVSNTGMMYYNVAEREENDYPLRKFAVFLASPTDFRYEEMQQDRQRLKDLEWSTKWIEFQGGHVVAPSSAYLEAGNWLNKHLIEGQPVPEGDQFSELESTEHISNGMKKEFYHNGNVSVEVSYQDGLRHGPYVSYYPDGKVWSKGHYAKGRKHREFTVYHNDGTLQRITHYQEGLKDGVAKDFDDNKLVSEDLYENGIMVRHNHYRRDHLDHIEEYKDGQIVKTTFFGPGGKEKYSIDYKDGKPQYSFWKLLMAVVSRY